MLKTETRNPKSTHIDQMDTISMLKLINEENLNSVKAVDTALPQIEKAVDAIVNSFKCGGRLFYIGAGTSGRLAVADAAECPPTFGVSGNMVNAIIAGGSKSMFCASENIEDQKEMGIEDLIAFDININDVLVGISASGGAAYVIGAMQKAKELGCLTISLTCNPDCPMDQIADINICTETGAEVITGSTRMKAGTAQKLVLNMLSTCSMIKTGKVRENLMINIKPQNEKLKKRIIGIVQELTKYDEVTAEKELEAHNWDINEVVKASLE